MEIACIVLPTYNEAENLPILLPLIFEQAEKITTHELHVLVVDDNSPDGTAAIVREAMHEYPRLHIIAGQKKGLGEAYQRGFAHALAELRPELILQMDADLQHDPVLLPEFIARANEGFGLVIGSRFAPGGVIRNFSWHRRWMSVTGTWLVQRVAGIPSIHDCTSGYRCIRAELLPRCRFARLSMRGYSFQSALLGELLRNGARVLEIPIVFSERRNGESKLSLRDQVEFLVNLFRLRPGRRD